MNMLISNILCGKCTLRGVLPILHTSSDSPQHRRL